MFTPSTVVRLLENVDITNDYNNTFSFANKSAQTSFFLTKSKYLFNDFTYQRKEKTVKVKQNIENLWNISYMMFQNTNFGTKWFYAFITDMKYLNDETTEISFEIDVLQTWYFEMDIKDCYIEREHTASDDIGEHLVDEGLATGDYIIRSTDTLIDLNPQAILVGSNYDPNTTTDVIGQVYTGIYSGIKYFAFDRVTGITALQLFLAGINGTTGKEDSVKAMFMVPKNLLPAFSDGDAITLPNALTINFTYNKNISDLDGYTPKNNKLFSYPYNMLYVSNHNGAVAEYKQEYFSTDPMQFYATCNISPNPVVTLVPKNYKDAFANFDEILRLADYAQCSWTNDAFQAYVAQAAVDAPIQIGGALIAGAATGGVGLLAAVPGLVGAIGGGIKAARQSDHTKGSVAGGTNTAIGIQTFGFYPKTIRSEYAQKIDNYFDKYGYKVNELRTPNLTSRLNWNYIKLYEANIFGNIPNNDLKKIHQIFTTGVTYWHNDNVGDYNRPNTP